MNKIAIVTDSTCDLPQDLLQEENIKVVGLYVNFTNESYTDGVNIDTKTLYQLVEQHKELPKTAAPAITQFVGVFDECLKEGYDIIYIGIGSSFSRSYDNALIAKEMLEVENIYIIDSQNLSSGTGLLLLRACRLRKQGLSAFEIAVDLIDTRGRVRSQFAIETMDYLHKGGRCSSLVKLFGTVFKIKPIIFVREGKMSVGSKPRGKMKVALDALLKLIIDDKDNVDLECIMVTHSIGDEWAEYLIPKVQEEFPNARVLETKAGCVISSHCGKGTIGILYILKNKFKGEENVRIS